jgi:hypothetical protein
MRFAGDMIACGAEIQAMRGAPTLRRPCQTDRMAL